METKETRVWKKVFESDLPYVADELRSLIDTPAMVIIDGTLGAGKTTFIKEFVKYGGGEATCSPSYSILSETPTVLHADLYRIKSSEEIIHLELSLYLEDKEYFMVEWGKDQFSSLYRELPDDYSTYLLEISINESGKLNTAESRNFVLQSISEE